MRALISRLLFPLVLLPVLATPDMRRTESPVICIDPGHPSEVNSGRTVQNGATEVNIDWLVGGKLLFPAAELSSPQ